MRYRVWGCAARTAVFWLAAAVAAFAFDFGSLKPEGYVSDFAGALDPATKSELERYCTAVEKSTGAQIALVTLRTLEGEPVEDVANLLFRKWGIGKKETDEGILLLLVIDDRRSRLEVGYGLEPYIPDGFAGSILRQMRPALRENHYGDAMLVAAHSIGQRIAEAKGVSLDQAYTPRQRPRRREESLPWPMVLGGLGLLLWMLGLGGGRRGYRRGGFGGSFLPALILGNLMGRSMHHSRGGGGFGGFDSGDSFGGFGGGDSGGGGASSDW